MDIVALKKRIYFDSRIEELLEKVGCHSIKNNGKYFSCANPDGDNPVGLQLFIEPQLGVINYTRSIPCAFNQPDIIDLIRFYRNNEQFSKTVKWICDTLGYEFYKSKKEAKKVGLVDYINKIKKLGRTDEDVDDDCFNVLDDKFLNGYDKMPNMLFHLDGIKPSVQLEFEIGMDIQNELITIPIRSELGDLVGVKGRITRKRNYEGESKYFYIEKCPKSMILYGLYKTYEHIIKEKRVYVVESEKAVMQLWSHGIKNSVAIGGHCLGKHQAFLLSKLGVEIILCYDKDVNMKEVCKITKKTYFEKEKMKFPPHLKVGYMFDKYDRLKEKDSPCDNLEFWNEFEIKY